MLQDAAPSPDTLKGRSEASIILASFQVWVTRLDNASELTPPCARRMRHHWPWAGILPGVSFLIPWVDILGTEVASTLGHEERSNHGA